MPHHVRARMKGRDGSGTALTADQVVKIEKSQNRGKNH
jgi:hypothetical protein